MLSQTPSQTVGPYFAYGLTPEQYRYDFPSWVSPDLHSPLQPQTVQLMGNVLDGAGNTIPDAMVEIWDANTQTLGRCGTGTATDHSFRFTVLKPTGASTKSPYFTVILFMRGLLLHTFTRVYFADEMALNEQDPDWAVYPEARKHTLLAKPEESHYRFDIHMQGPQETLFLSI